MCIITPTKPNRILVIEDEPSIREVCRLALDDECFQIDTVENGDAALNKLRVTEYDLYLIDIRMPTMDGIEFYRQLKIELPRLLDKIVFTTGDLMNIDVIDFLEETGRPLLPKPFSIEDLKNMVRRSLGIASG